MTIHCVDCGTTETLVAAEAARFDNLLKTVKGFQMPKRCGVCRKRRRDEKPASVPQTRATVPAPSPTPVIVMSAKPSIAVLDPANEADMARVNLVLATKDFDDLVNGRPVVYKGVKVILADIGFEAMRRVIDEAEIDRAKKHIKSNGH